MIWDIVKLVVVCCILTALCTGVTVDGKHYSVDCTCGPQGVVLNHGAGK